MSSVRRRAPLCSCVALIRRDIRSTRYCAYHVLTKTERISNDRVLFVPAHHVDDLFVSGVQFLFLANAFDVWQEMFG